MINITSDKAKRAFAREMDRQMQRLENIFVKEIRPILNRSYFNAASLVRQSEMHISSAVNKNTDRMINVLFSHYKRVANVFGNKAFKIIDGSKSINIPEIKTPRDEFFRAMQVWMSTQAGNKITKIDAATKKNIVAVIQKGLNDGISHKEIAKNIRKNGLIVNRSRALTIARTETHTASVKSVDESVKSTRIEMEREWVSSKDLRTRSRMRGDSFEHFLKFPRGADGEKTTQKGVFRGTGETLSFPGDPRGSAANSINCR